MIGRKWAFWTQTSIVYHATSQKVNFYVRKSNQEQDKYDQDATPFGLILHLHLPKIDILASYVLNQLEKEEIGSNPWDTT